MSFTNPYPASRLTLDPANSLANGLVGFWALTNGSGSTAKDITSNANDGTLGTGVTWSAGNLGTNAEFPSTTAGRIDTALDMVGSSAVTVSAWVRNDGGAVTNSFGKIVSQSHVGSFDTYMDKNANAALSLKINSTTVVANNADIPAIGTWFHVCFVWQQSVTQAVYINGELSNSGTADTSVIGATTHNVFIGGTSAAPRPWDGGIQNVRIYNRALSDTEVATLYNRPWESTNFGTLWPYSPPVPSSATLSTDTAATSLNVDLECWWLCTDNTGTTLVDISGNGRDATLNGTNSWVADSVGTVNRFDNDSTTGNNATRANVQLNLSTYTACFWVKHEELYAGTNDYGGGIVLTNGVFSSLNSDLEIYTNSFATTSQYLQIIHNRNNGGSIVNYNVGGSAAEKQADNGSWVFWAVTYDGTNIRQYKNGVLRATSGTVVAPISTTGKKIGINQLGDNNGLTCSMQNIRLYSRALSADEITLLYERPFEGITYGDAFHYDPPTPANLTPLTSDAINNSQIGWWPLTETDDYASGAADISGNANNGTQSGGVLSEVSPLGGVASFDGIDDYIDIVGPPANTVTQPLTLSAWVYNDPAGSGTNDLVALGKTTSLDPLGILRFTYSTGEFSAVFRAASIASIISDAPNNPTGTWHHVCVLASSSTSLELFIDGVSVASNTSTNYGTLSYDNLTIGALQRTTVSNYSDGNVANVRLWDRVLTSDEVWSIYSNPWLGSAYQASAAAVYYNYILRNRRFRRLG